MWVINCWPIWVFAVWMLKIRFHDMPAEKRKAVADAKRQETENLKYWANVKKADLMIENLVERGAPVCLLWDRKFSDREIIVPDEPSQSLMFLHDTYQTYYEARKLQED